MSTSGANGSDDSSGENSDTSDADWFSSACGVMFDGKAGTALHYLTGFEERSCQRYAAGHAKPPAYFLRALLRSEEGDTWLNLVMDGATAKWWLRKQKADRIYRALAAELRE